MPAALLLAVAMLLPFGPSLAAQAAEPLVPPVAEKRPKVLDKFGDKRVDDYFWLREKDNPEVIAYLEAENKYSQAVMKPLEGFRESLYKEMLARIKETDESVPYVRHGYWYYTRQVEGLQYPIYCRRKGSMEAPEEILLDENELAKGHKYMAIGSMDVSPDGMKLAYTVDFTGFRQYQLRVKNLADGRMLPDVAERVTSLAWAADNRTLFYVEEHETTKRSYRLHRLALGSAPEVVYEEADEVYDIGVGETRSEAFVVVTSASKDTSEIRVLRTNDPRGEFRVIEKRRKGHEYYLDHHEGEFFIRTNDKGPNFRLVRAPVADPQRKHWKQVVAHRPLVMLEEIDLFKDFWVLVERDKGLIRLREGRVFMEGDVRASDLGTIDRSGGSGGELILSGTLNLGGGVFVLSAATTGRIDLNGGTITTGTLRTDPGMLDVNGTFDNITLDAPLTARALTVTRDLTLTNNATLTVVGTDTGANTRFNYLIGQNLAGNGTFVFAGDTAQVGTLTIGAGVTVTTGNSSGGGFEGKRLVNNGLIWSRTAGATLTIGNGTTSWSNQGTLRATDGILYLGGAFTVADIGTIERSGNGSIGINGYLNNAGHTLALEQGQELAPRQLDALAQGALRARGLEGTVEVVDGGDDRREHGGAGVDGGLLAVALHALPVVLELGALAQELVAQLVALLAQRLHLLAVQGRHRLHVHAGHAPGLVAGCVVPVVPVVAFPIARGHDLSSLRVWLRARATCSTSAIMRPYSMRVLPTTPRPQAPSGSRGTLAVTSATWRRSGSGFSWPMVIRTPSLLRHALRILTSRPFSSKALKSARMRAMSLSSGASRSLDVPSR